MAGVAGVGHNRCMTARRIGSQAETTYLGHVRLYRDELEKIAAAVAEVGELTILCDDDWEPTDPADLSNEELPELLSRVSIGAQGNATKDAPRDDRSPAGFLRTGPRLQ